MGNTVGSKETNFCNFLENEKDSYILGLWCADGYWWSSSIGLSNIDSDLINLFRNFFRKFFPEERIKYNRHHLFVNSRPLLREFLRARENLQSMQNKNALCAYFAGRFDGDGSIDKNLKSDCRIVYSRKNEAEIDKDLLARIGINNTKIYYYKTAKTFCLYISRFQAKEFLEKIQKYSVKLQKLVSLPRRDLILAKKVRESNAQLTK